MELQQREKAFMKGMQLFLAYEVKFNSVFALILQAFRCRPAPTCSSQRELKIEWSVRKPFSRYATFLGLLNESENFVRAFRRLSGVDQFPCVLLRGS